MQTPFSCIIATENQLGEGPFWDTLSERLYWCDIKRSLLHCLEPISGDHRAFDLGVRASALTRRARGGFLMATENGLAHFDEHTGIVTPRRVLEAPPGFRSNDAKIDVAGRFWWSSMDDDGGRRPGKLFVQHPDGRCETAVAAISIANTVSCSPDGRTFYLADSAEQLIYAYDLDPATGALSGQRIFVDLRGGEASPDGSAVDAEGFLWNAQWGAWRVVRYAPDGSVARIMPLPVEQPTSCAFGGPGLKTLYVTSAQDGLSPEALGEQPLAGALFAVETGVAGLPLPLFEG